MTGRVEDRRWGASEVSSAQLESAMNSTHVHQRFWHRGNLPRRWAVVSSNRRELGGKEIQDERSFFFFGGGGL